MVTVLDDDGRLVDADQRAVVQFVIQEGYGADVVFAAGTTGEWDRVDNRVRQQVVQVCAEEVAKANALLGRDQGPGASHARAVESCSPADEPESLWRSGKNVARRRIPAG